MVRLLLICIPLLISSTAINEKVRIIHFEGKDYQTTFAAPDKFIGLYKGNGDGYLELREDGTGTYHYDIFFAPPECNKAPIELEWGFLLDENNAIVSFTRKYGRSYPVLLRSTSETTFQGCRETVMLDFILDYSDGPLVVSSSDDWIKE